MRTRLPGGLRSLPLALVLVGTILTCPSNTLAAEKLRISGTGSALGTIQQLAATFEKEHGVLFELPASMGSSGGIKAVKAGALDIAVSSRPLKEEERQQGLAETPYAKTLFVPIAHPSVPTESISRAEVVGALLGSFTNWPNGERVRFVLRPESDTDSKLLKSLSPEISRAVDAARSREGMLVAMTDQDNTELIENTPGSVGFSSHCLVVTERRAVKVLALDGVRPDRAGKRSGADLPVKTLYLVTRTDASNGVNAFIRFVLSPRGKEILERTGNSPL